MNFDKKLNIYNKYLSYLTQDRISKFEKLSQQRTRYITVVLEDINQTHNISAALRSCDCFGLQDVHVIESVHKYTEDEGVSRGASKWLDIYRYNEQSKNNTEKCFINLRKKGYKIAATTPHTNDFTIDQLPLDNKIALVFGTEYSGVSDYVKNNADYFVKIPMFGFTESFNISVSVAISLYELSKRLRTSTYDWQMSEEEILDLKLSWLARSTNVAELKNFLPFE